MKTKCIENVLSLLDEWQAYRRASGESVNSLLDALVEWLDWDLVAPKALRAALALILENAPKSECEDISNEADKARASLVEYVGLHPAPSAAVRRIPKIRNDRV